jgi:D-glycero-D-manno-heptose 1,7-bisphosphate phosphatase
VSLVPGAVEGLTRLRVLGLGLAVVTNQSGIGRGLFTHAAAEEVNARVTTLLAAEGVKLDGIYMCPHRPDEGCRCRKPAPGLVEQAARELGFDPLRGFMIGDRAVDMKLGRQVGAPTFLVRTGYGAAQQADAVHEADYVVDDLLAAADLIGHILQVIAVE